SNLQTSNLQASNLQASNLQTSNLQTSNLQIGMSMEICILSFYPNSTAKSGLSTYSRLLCEGLSKKHQVKFLIGSTLLARLAFLTPLFLFFNRNKFDAFVIAHPEAGFLSHLFLKGKKVLLVFHDADSFEKPPKAQNPISSAFRFMLNKFYTAASIHSIKASSILTCNSSLSKASLEKISGRGDVKVVAHGISNIFVPAKNSSSGKNFRIGYIGSLIGRKNLAAALEYFSYAYKSDKSLTFSIFGQGVQKPMLQDTVRKLGLGGAVSFGDFVEESKLVQTYASLDAFFLPSISEGFGLNILEAQRVGIPVIVFSQSTIPQEVSKAAIKVGSRQEFLAALSKLKEPAYYSQVQKAGLDHSNNFYFENHVGKIERLLES
ncbi:glycosyltransferase, partial [Candidatus Parvarchaeota archaeon]|nr:glycosyltransferase [Candidatus Parvarchaeota archaeon]